MTLPPVSVVIVSHGRPNLLGLCLTGVGQLDYPHFEIVVVADAGGADAVRAHALGEQVKLVVFDTPNIAAARNAGIAQAGGDVIAFIDDDAVPEPMWLQHLITPFQDVQVAAAGGYVIGRNGISFQWRGRAVGVDAQTEDIALPGDAPVVFDGTAQRGIKTEGTNMAVRRNVLAALGGFDPAFHFYLDETDLNMRLGQMGHKTAIVPLAQVHHGYAKSARRSAERVPRDLHQIGASLAVYLRKHGGDPGRFAPEREAQRRRLLRHMVVGRLVPSDVGRVLATFDAGWADGMTRNYGGAVAFTQVGLRAFEGQMSAKRRVISGRFWQWRRKCAQAKAATRRGERVTVILLSLSAKYHRVGFTAEGFWLQAGGQFGKSDRSDRRIQLWRASARIERENERVAPVR